MRVSIAVCVAFGRANQKTPFLAEFFACFSFTNTVRGKFAKGEFLKFAGGETSREDSGMYNRFSIQARAVILCHMAKETPARGETSA